MSTDAIIWDYSGGDIFFVVCAKAVAVPGAAYVCYIAEV